MKTQRQIVEEQLKKYGKVSRNWALKRYISRLGAIIYLLKQEGLEIVGLYQKSGNVNDYVYHNNDFIIKL